MARPKSTDPKISITLRLPQSILDVWSERAEQKGRTTKEHLEAKLIEAVIADRQKKTINEEQ